MYVCSENEYKVSKVRLSCLLVSVSKSYVVC